MVNRTDIVSYLEAGLRAAGTRQRVIADNLANQDTPNFLRNAVDFETLLQSALKSGGELDPKEVAPQIYKPGNTPKKKNGNDVLMEMEIGDLIKNAGRYKAYARMLNKMFRQMELAINGSE